MDLELLPSLQKITKRLHVDIRCPVGETKMWIGSMRNIKDDLVGFYEEISYDEDYDEEPLEIFKAWMRRSRRSTG